MANRQNDGVIIRRLLAALLICIGAAALWGGVILVQISGSPYYLLGGLMVVAAGVLVWRGSRLGALLYALFLLATLLWGYWEAGADAWALAPRLIAPAVLGLCFALPPLWHGLGRREPSVVVGVSLLSLAVITGIALWPADYAAGRLPPAVTPLAAGNQDGEWPVYGRTPGGGRFSPLAQITPANVSGLRQAWVYHTGVVQAGAKSPLQATPIMVGDTVYLCTQTNIVIALDAETGQERWRFDPKIDATGASVVTTCRGVAYHSTPEQAECPARIISATFDARLLALDARTGRPCSRFGKGGAVNLRDGMGVVPPGFYYVSSAPVIVRGVVTVGGWVADNQTTDAPSGVIRGYDALTGKLLWAWDAGKPNRTGASGSGETYTRGSPNSWAPMSGDEALGLVYIPTGNPSPDHYGGLRSPSDDKYGSAVVALDASNGVVRWSFQTTHHDVWDYDVASQPTLMDITVRGQTVPALVQATKRGELFMLDRRTGIPLSRVEERKVPQRGAVERLSPTQPFSTGLPSVGGTPLTEADMWGLTPLDQLWCRIEFRKLRYEGPMTPPGTDRALIYPSIGGGVNWGSVTVDPSRNIMLVNSMHYGTVIQLVPRSETDRRLGLSSKGNYSHSFALPQPQLGTPWGVLLSGLESPLQAPCNKPPFGKLHAIDLTTKSLLWSRPIGSARDTGPFNIASGLPLEMGMPNFGGSIATASGLVFIGATQDKTFRAFDINSGEQLWQSRLPAGGQANPMTYRSPRSGRQFVLISAGGHALLRSQLGDAVVAYALPKD